MSSNNIKKRETLNRYIFGKNSQKSCIASKKIPTAGFANMALEVNNGTQFPQILNSSFNHALCGD